MTPFSSQTCNNHSNTNNNKVHDPNKNKTPSSCPNNDHIDAPSSSSSSSSSSRMMTIGDSSSGAATAGISNKRRLATTSATAPATTGLSSLFLSPQEPNNKKPRRRHCSSDSATMLRRPGPSSGGVVAPAFALDNATSTKKTTEHDGTSPSSPSAAIKLSAAESVSVSPTPHLKQPGSSSSSSPSPFSSETTTTTTTTTAAPKNNSLLGGGTGVPRTASLGLSPAHFPSSSSSRAQQQPLALLKPPLNQQESTLSSNSSKTTTTTTTIAATEDISLVAGGTTTPRKGSLVSPSATAAGSSSGMLHQLQPPPPNQQQQQQQQQSSSPSTSSGTAGDNINDKYDPNYRKRMLTIPGITSPTDVSYEQFFYSCLVHDYPSHALEFDCWIDDKPTKGSQSEIKKKFRFKQLRKATTIMLDMMKSHDTEFFHIQDSNLPYSCPEKWYSNGIALALNGFKCQSINSLSCSSQSILSLPQRFQLLKRFVQQVKVLGSVQKSGRDWIIKQWGCLDPPATTVSLSPPPINQQEPSPSSSSSSRSKTSSRSSTSSTSNINTYHDPDVRKRLLTIPDLTSPTEVSYEQFFYVYLVHNYPALALEFDCSIDNKPIDGSQCEIKKISRFEQLRKATSIMIDMMKSHNTEFFDTPYCSPERWSAPRIVALNGFKDRTASRFSCKDPSRLTLVQRFRLLKRFVQQMKEHGIQKAGRDWVIAQWDCLDYPASTTAAGLESPPLPPQLQSERVSVSSNKTIAATKNNKEINLIPLCSSRREEPSKKASTVPSETPTTPANDATTNNKNTSTEEDQEDVEKRLIIGDLVVGGAKHKGNNDRLGVYIKDRERHWKQKSKLSEGRFRALWSEIKPLISLSLGYAFQGNNVEIRESTTTGSKEESWEGAKKKGDDTAGQGSPGPKKPRATEAQGYCSKGDDSSSSSSSSININAPGSSIESIDCERARIESSDESSNVPAEEQARLDDDIISAGPTAMLDANATSEKCATGKNNVDGNSLFEISSAGIASKVQKEREIESSELLPRNSGSTTSARTSSTAPKRPSGATTTVNGHNVDVSLRASDATKNRDKLVKEIVASILDALDNQSTKLFKFILVRLWSEWQLKAGLEMNEFIMLWDGRVKQTIEEHFSRPQMADLRDTVKSTFPTCKRVRKVSVADKSVVVDKPMASEPPQTKDRVQKKLPVALEESAVVVDEPMVSEPPPMEVIAPTNTSATGSSLPVPRKRTSSIAESKSEPTEIRLEALYHKVLTDVQGALLQEEKANLDDTLKTSKTKWKEELRHLQHHKFIALWSKVEDKIVSEHGPSLLSGATDWSFLWVGKNYQPEKYNFGTWDKFEKIIMK